MTSAQHTTQK